MTSTNKRLLPWQVFNELDREFFRSMLKGNVSLGWSKLAPGVLSHTRRAGLDGNPRTRIELSPVLFEEGYRRDVFAALMHQMTHAYYLQCCGYRDPNRGAAGYDLEHGRAFLALLKCIGKHCEPLRKALSTELWNPYLGHRRTHHGPLQNSIAGVSSCYAQASRYNDVDIQEWRDTAVATTASLHDAQKPNGTGQRANNSSFPQTVYSVNKEGQEETPRSLENLQYSRGAYFFIGYENRHYAVLRHSLTDIAALKNSPYFKDGDFLQLPPSTKQEDFLTFWFFIVYKGFPPALKDLNGQAAMNPKGPPAMRSYESGAPKILMQLITAFRLSQELEHKPFQEHTMTGLLSLQATAEDPMAVLETIYDSSFAFQQPLTSISYKAADPQLRDWVKAWLEVDLLNSKMSQYEATHKTNLGVLRCHPNWSQRFVQLRNKSSALGEDEELASRAICQRHQVKEIHDIALPMPLPCNLPPPTVQYSSPMQQPYQMTNWSSPQHNRAGPQWVDNAPQLFNPNLGAFQMSGLVASLPIDQPYGLCDQANGPIRRIHRPEEMQGIALIHQQNAMKNASGRTDPNHPWHYAFHQQPPGPFQ
ncbi:MAG: hypothetical protein Q9209_003486 [Squamulea sp. 1 TL-2023]